VQGERNEDGKTDEPGKLGLLADMKVQEYGNFRHKRQHGMIMPALSTLLLVLYSGLNNDVEDIERFGGSGRGVKGRKLRLRDS